MKGWSSGSVQKFRDRIVVDPQRSPASDNVKENQDMLKQVKQPNKHEEDDLQMNCIETFRLIYPKLYYHLYHIANGGKRDTREAARLKKMGVVPGTLDLFLSVPKSTWSGMYIEMKTSEGRLSENQIAFIKEHRDKYKCVVCRSVEDFLKEIKLYLSS